MVYAMQITGMSQETKLSSKKKNFLWIDTYLVGEAAVIGTAAVKGIRHLMWQAEDVMINHPLFYIPPQLNL